MSFRGTYDYSLDAKNRLTIPAKLRGTLAAGVVLAMGLEPCVTVWTPGAYDSYTRAALENLHPLSPDARKLKRFLSANSVTSELDSAGRVMIPPFLHEYAGLAKEVVVIGNDESLEVWDRATWADYNASLSAEMNAITSQFGNAA